VYMYKDRLDPKIYTGPVWDFDLAFDNDVRVYPMNRKSAFLYQSGVMCANQMDVMARRILVEDRTTKSELSQMWSRLRNGGRLDAEAIGSFIDQTYKNIKASADLNFERWPILRQAVHQNPRTPNTYEEEITFVKNFVWERIEKLDGPSFMNLDPTVSSIDDVVSDADASGIYVSGRCIGVEGDVAFRVVSASGITVYSGSGMTPELQPGVYVVSRGLSPAVRVLVR
ncbi:MAG: CotH kinase family protein, partial [Muribaculaceae bacterium]|nr:CotH kinase family protein [Muribaculaceae bacterium]